MTYTLRMEAASTRNLGGWIELVRNGVRRLVMLETVHKERAVAVVYWPLAGQYDLCLQTGQLKHQVLPLDGVYSIDIDTGRIEGTRCSIDQVDLERIDEIRVGDELRLIHDEKVGLRVVVRDVLIRGDGARLHLRTDPRSLALAREFVTGWRASSELLQSLRAIAREA